MAARHRESQRLRGPPGAARVYFGHLVGETGDAVTPSRVSAADLAGVKRALNTAAGLSGPYDINRDGRVNALDIGIVRANVFRSLPPINPPTTVMPTPAPATAPAAAVAPLWDESQPDLLHGSCQMTVRDPALSK